MVPNDSLKYVWLIRPQAIVDNDDPVGAYGDTNPLSVDTAGWNKVDIIFGLGATDIAMTALRVMGGDVAASGADDTDYTALPGYTFGTGDAPALPADDADNNLYRFSINKEEHPYRYFALDATMGNGSTGTFSMALAVLSSPEVHPNTAAERGFAAEVLPG